MECVLIFLQALAPYKFLLGVVLEVGVKVKVQAGYPVNDQPLFSTHCYYYF